MACQKRIILIVLHQLFQNPIGLCLAVHHRFNLDRIFHADSFRSVMLRLLGYFSGGGFLSGFFDFSNTVASSLPILQQFSLLENAGIVVC
jgi:hypothetical protein